MEILDTLLYVSGVLSIIFDVYGLFLSVLRVIWMADWLIRLIVWGPDQIF
jgi:hypothetical protein